MEAKEAQSPTPPGAVFGMSRKAQLAILVIVCVVAIGLFVIGPAGIRALLTKEKPEAAKEEEKPFQLTAQQWATIKTEKVKEIAFQPERQADGKIAIDGDASTPVYPPYNGRVTALFAREGDKVTRGQPLFQIDSADLIQAQNDLVSAVAGVAKAAAQITLLQTAEQRAQQLYDIHGAALKDLQQAQADLAAAQNDQKTAQITLGAAQAKLRIFGQSDETIAKLTESRRATPDLSVPAPIDGYVLQRKLGPGQYVSQGASDPVFVIGDLSSVWLIANVRESDAPFVKKGQFVEIRLTAFPERTFDATIDYVASAVDPNTHRLPIRAKVPNPDGLLKPEMWANFTIVTGASHKGLGVPEEAIVYEGDSARVWVTDRPRNTINAHDVKIGVTNRNQVEILSGVEAGEEVITRGSIFIDRAATSE